MAKDDAIFLQVLNNRLKAIVEEMAQNILRAAHSTFIKESWDLGALLTTTEGEVFICPKAVAQKRLGMHLGAALKNCGEIQPGDIFVSNDPRLTGGLATHLPDIYFWKPVFYQGELVCFALSFIHVSDVGGLVPGSISPAAVDLYQEGLTIPPVRLFAGGNLQREVRDMILAHTRVPNQQWGDIAAVVGALNVAERRVHELLERYPLPQFRAGVKRLMDLAEERARSLIRDIPNGSYRFVDYIDGLPNMEPIRLCLTLKVEDETITMDFEGSDPEVRAAYNLHSFSLDGHWNLSRAFADYFQTLDPDVPWNSGLVRQIRVAAPKGTVLNPRTPAACGSRVATFFRVYNMIFGALAQAIPGAVPSSGPGESGIMLIAANDPITGERKMNVGEPLFGGSGGRPMDDGFDGNEFVSAYLGNIPVEILEAEMPMRFVEYGLASGSAGAGRYRGGLGVRVAVQLFAPYTTMSIRGIQRHQFRAWGVAGGHAGTKGTVILNPGKPTEQELPVVTVLNLKPGDVVKAITAGGGGLGDPMDREPERVARDVAEGYLEASAALQDYGVVIVEGKLDLAGTGAEREQRRAQRPTVAAIDYGPERVEYEKVWTPEIYAELERLTAGKSQAAAQYMREQLIATVQDQVAAGRPAPAAGDLERLLAERVAAAG